MTPETKARLNIDKMLTESGYVLQDMKEFNRLAAVGIAVREFPTNSGPVDYLLFVDGSPVGVVEAKAEDKGVSLATAAEQSIRYAKSGLKYMSTIPDIRFIYESTGILTNFVISMMTRLVQGRCFLSIVRKPCSNGARIRRLCATE
ncbi:type I restriction endonuclease [Cohnella cellulosilytica]|uniref:type I restriction endonuclease n=1 Tax=Cohnella cellulosilytica TaxID=986710 RepID=UPI00361B5024